LLRLASAGATLDKAKICDTIFVRPGCVDFICAFRRIGVYGATLLPATAHTTICQGNESISKNNLNACVLKIISKTLILIFFKEPATCSENKNQIQNIKITFWAIDIVLKSAVYTTQAFKL